MADDPVPHTTADPDYARRIAWLHQARFGLFIHYGLYAIPGRGEWVQFRERIPRDDYRRLAEQFAPAANCADQWVQLAVRAGMKYAVLTTKHHDGFCLFPTDTVDFHIGNFLPGRDLVGEFVEACRRHGLKVGFYLSNIDWGFPGYFEPEAYPENRDALVQSLHDQTRELLTRYGKIDVLWYDGAWVAHGKVEVPSIPAFWRSEELLAMIRELQPDILVNNRLGLPADLDTPEQHVTASETGRGWESCMTIGDPGGWGWIRHNPNRKTLPQLLQNLCLAAAGEGNFLLNIGPMPDGSVDLGDREPLESIGRWLADHGQAIYGSKRIWPGNVHHSQGIYIGGPDNGAYLCLFRYSSDRTVLIELKTPVRTATLLGVDQPLTVETGANGKTVLTGFPAAPPHPAVSVVKLDLAGPAEPFEEPDKAAWIEGKLS
ncbi:MAG: alpha-L-fucosidase [Opitutales bacterium]